MRLSIDGMRPAGFTKIYCKCGSIVSIDKSAASLKKKLNKKLECPACRNARISQDIDEMNNIFDGIAEEMYC